MKKIITITLIFLWLIDCASTSGENITSKETLPKSKKVLIAPDEALIIKKYRESGKYTGEKNLKGEIIFPLSEIKGRENVSYIRGTTEQIEHIGKCREEALKREGGDTINIIMAYVVCSVGKEELIDIDNDGIIDYIVLIPTKSEGSCKINLNSDGTQQSIVCDFFNDDHVIAKTIHKNENGFPNQFIYYDPKKETKPNRCITKVDYDTNNNGRLDKWDYYENCKLVRREIDENENGAKEEIAYYNQKGEYDHSWSIGGDNVKKANDAFEAKKYDEAISFYQAANQELSKEWGADTDKINFNLFQLTIAYLQKKEYQKCITTAKQLSDKDLSDEAKSNVFFYSGTCQLDLRNYTQAEKDFEASIKFTKSNDMKSNAHYNFACSLALQSKGGLALDHLKKAISFSADQGSVRKAAKKDSDFTNLVNDPEFKKLVE